jgi:hypothetical protein
VSFEWYLESLTAGRFVDEASYLVRGDEVFGDNKFVVQRHFSLSTTQSSFEIFRGYTFILKGSFLDLKGPTKSELANLIMDAGGRLSNRSKNNESVIVITDKENSSQEEEGVFHYKKILDHISQLKKIDLII